MAVSGAITTIGDEPSARAATPAASCKLADCGNAAWVKDCNAAVTCAHIPAPNANLGERVPSQLPPSLGGKAVPSIHRMPPQMQMQKRPGTVVATGPGTLDAAKTYAPPSAKWQLAPGAPAPLTIDRRRIGARASFTSTDAMQGFGITFAGMKTQWTLEDQKATQRAREDAAIVNRRPQWVGDPTKENYHATTAHSAVTSCDDYAYKKMFEQAWFRDAALTLGSDYRGVWSIATRADSPVRLTRTLSAYGGSAITPGITEDGLAASNVFLEYQFAWKPTGAQGWALATQLEQSHRAITDAEFEDIARRELRFSDMLTQLFTVKLKLAALFCQDKKGTLSWTTGDFDSIQCDSDTSQGGGGTSTKPGDDGKKHPKEKAPDAAFDARKAARPILTAALRTHPALTVVGPQSTTALRVSRTKLLVSSLKGVNAYLTSVGVTSSAISNQLTVTPTISGGGANVVGSGGRHGVDTSACTSGKLSTKEVQKCFARARVTAVQADVDDAIAFEKSLGAAGCTHPDMIANHCNWSYKGFAESVAARSDWTYLAKDCKARIPDFGALTDKSKQSALANARTLFASDVGTNYAASWGMVDLWFKEVNDAAAKWLEYDKLRKVYLGKVAATVRQAAGMPRTATGYGTSSSDGFDVGHPETFGGGAHYGFSWAVAPMALGKPFYSADMSCGPAESPPKPPTPCGVEKRICRFNGAINATADAKASLFGFDVSILDAKLTAYAEDSAKHANKGGGHLDAHFTLLGNELFTQEVKNGIDVPASPTFHIARPVADVSASYPDPPLEMGFMVGPIPVTLEAGMSVGAGIDLSADGDVEDTCSLAGGTQPSFSLVAALSPHVEADAFGQAGVDLLVVEAGVRINLNLVQVGLPVAFGIKVNSGTTTLDAHADLTLAALSGSVGIFAEVHYLVGSDDYELPIFSWNGISASRSLLDDQLAFPTDALSYLMNPPDPWRKPL